MSTYKDLTGKKFYRLLVIERIGLTKHNKAIFLCQCDCGNKIKTVGSALIAGNSKSCGCYRTERIKTYSPRYRENNPSEYAAWIAMRNRCKTSNKKDFKSYKGKGITYCKEWESFENFLNDMGRKPTPKHSIDRINNHGNYEPSNCRWATPIEQSRNTSRTRIIKYNGIEKCITDWAKEIGESPKLIYDRLRLGWDIEKALTKKKKKRSLIAPASAEVQHVNEY